MLNPGGRVPPSANIRVTGFPLLSRGAPAQRPRHRLVGQGVAPSRAGAPSLALGASGAVCVGPEVVRLGFAPLRLAGELVAPHLLEARRLQTRRLLPPHVVLIFFAQAVVALAPWLPVVARLGSWGEDLLWSVGWAVAGDEWELGLRAWWRLVVGTLAPLHGGRAGAVVSIGDHVVPCFGATSMMLGILEVFSAVLKQIVF